MTRRLTARDAVLRSTRRTLTRAFADDPMMAHLLPDTGRRGRRLPAFLSGPQSHCLRYGEVWAVDDGSAVSCWLPPGRTSPTTGQALRGGLLLSGLRLGPSGLSRLGRLTKVMDAAHEHAVPGPHWYLFLLAVDPEQQGRGLSGEVLRPVLERADADGLPVYLDTHNPANPAFYARYGFGQAATDVVDGLRFWGLLRPPQG